MSRYLALAFLVACGSPETRIHLDIAAEAVTGVENYQLRLDGHGATAAALAELEMVVPNDMVGRNVELEVWGLVAGTQVAYGITMVTPVMHSTVIAHLTLAAVSCGTWCTLGDAACANDGQIACEMQPNGCVGWSTPVACPTATPYCSNGTCAAQCTDECATGEIKCDSSAALRTCGQFDSDTCLDWSAPVPCTNGQTCSNGTCATAASCAADGDPCDDGNACTTGDTCGGGVCAGASKCTAPANADPTCASDGTCDFACRSGYHRSGSSCVVTPKVMFASSTRVAGGLGGLSGADAFCQNLAGEVGLPGTFKAWLSDSHLSAAMRLAHSTAPYVLVDGTTVAADWTQLTSGMLQHAINEDETGVVPAVASVWTGTLADGSTWKGVDNCANWYSSSSQTNTGSWGEMVAVPEWTEYHYGAGCGYPMAVYCVEQ